MQPTKRCSLLSHDFCSALPLVEHIISLVTQVFFQCNLSLFWAKLTGNDVPRSDRFSTTTFDSSGLSLFFRHRISFEIPQSIRREEQLV